ncbi:polymer biosynthesis protein, WecB/TagA/CpsF family [Lachnospiraceae bacterium]|nr:polymer biosynthesis protein, WecB/TagA/CpsF family [Lachnospiraceae bacterium]
MVILFDTLSSIISLILAMVTRFIGFSGILRPYPRDHALYNSLFFLVVILNILSWSRNRKKEKPLQDQDPAQRLSAVLKNRGFMFVLLLLYLYITMQSSQISRIVMAFFLLYDVILDMIFRTYLSHFLRDDDKNNVLLNHRLVIIGDKARLHLIRRRLELSGDKKIGINAELSFDDIRKSDIQKTLSDLKTQGSTEILLDTTNLSDRQFFHSIIDTADKLEMIVRIIETADGEFAGSDQFETFSNFMIFRYSGMHAKADVLGVHYAVSNVPEAVLYVKKHLRDLSGKYLCFSNVHTTITAGEDDAYKNILNSSAVTFPDGSPIARTMRSMGISNAHQVAGPDFMEAMFQASMDGSVRHYFYGASEKTLEALRQNLESSYPGIVIAGMYSPPFRPLSPEEDAEDVSMINATQPDIVWVGLGAPKQEKWMYAHMDRVQGVMCGVGAGFDFHAGTVRRAPGWVQRINLEWFYRLLQDPVRLFKRYFITNSKFIIKVIIMRITHRNRS